MEPNIAVFKCLKCNHIWMQEPAQTKCPMCGHVYVKWENFEKWRKDHMEYPYN